MADFLGDSQGSLEGWGDLQESLVRTCQKAIEICLFLILSNFWGLGGNHNLTWAPPLPPMQYKTTKTIDFVCISNYNFFYQLAKEEKNLEIFVFRYNISNFAIL